MDLVFWGLPSQKPECHPGVLCFLDSSPPNQPEPVTCAAPSLLLLCRLSTPALISPFPLQPLPPHPHRAATVIFLEHQTHPASSQLETPQDPPLTQEHSEVSPATPFSSLRTELPGLFRTVPLLAPLGHPSRRLLGNTHSSLQPQTRNPFLPVGAIAGPLSR